MTPKEIVAKFADELETFKPIHCTHPYAFLHQSWRMHTRPLNPLINDPNQLPFYLGNHYTYITPITHAPTHHYPNDSSQISPPSFQNIILLAQVSKQPRLSLSDPYLQAYIYDLKKTSSTSHSICCLHRYYTKHTLPTTTFCTFFVL